VGLIIIQLEAKDMMLENKRIIITGGSLGIGLAISKKCAKEGAQVIIAARNKVDLENALIELNQISPQNHKSYTLDVSILEDVLKFRDWIKNEVGTISGLVNCAGVYGPIGKSTTIDLLEFGKAIAINFLGSVYMCSTFAPLMKSVTNKKIINISGGGAATPFPNYSAYATSKIALVRFTENLALELKSDQFDVNSVAPGFVITRIHNKTIEAGHGVAGENFYRNTEEQIEKGGVPPETAADLVSFLLSVESDNITGKFLSAPWDPWHTAEFQEQLKSEPDTATLRRIDNKHYYKK
jgi:NAD(P)-dependent dehydrogenase (short-subunit alcohol dehydrogenase family)